MTEAKTTAEVTVAAERPTEKRRWVALARVGRPHGVRGEVKLQSFNDSSTLVFEAEELRLRRKGKPPEMVRLESARPGGEHWIVRFEGVEDRDGAARLTHGELSVPRELLPPLEDGEYYHVDVLGAEVVDEASGAVVGKVRHVHAGANELLEIRLAEGGDLMVPVIPDYVVSIGEEPGRVVVRDLDHWQA